jgi:hypothetical protein
MATVPFDVEIPCLTPQKFENLSSNKSIYLLLLDIHVDVNASIRYSSSLPPKDGWAIGVNLVLCSNTK